MSKSTNKTLRLTSFNGTIKYFIDVPSIILRQANGNKAQMYIASSWIEIDQSIEEAEALYDMEEVGDYPEYD